MPRLRTTKKSRVSREGNLLSHVVHYAIERREADEILKQRTEQIIRHQAVLLELAKKDNSDFDQILKQMTEADARTLGVERVSIWFFNEERSEILCRDLYRLKEGIHES